MNNSIRLASYNLRKCVGLDRRRNPDRSLAVINSLNADIIALQEADRRLGKRPAALPRNLIEQNSDFQPLDLDETGVSLGWHGNALLLRKGLTANSILRLDLPGLEPRGAVIANIGDLRVVAVHFGLLRRDRQLQMAAVNAALSSLPSMPTVIMGDFNEWSRAKGMAPFQKNYIIHAPGLSYHAARPVAGLDRFAVSRDLQLKSAGVMQNQISKRASDHLPIWADITQN